MDSIGNFSQSFVTFVAKPSPNICRIPIDCRLLITNKDQLIKECFLTTPIKAENMYVKNNLFVVPNYDFQGIWWAEGFKILRVFPLYDSRLTNQVEWGSHQEKFTRVDIHMKTDPLDTVQSLTSAAEIVEKTLNHCEFVARTKIRDNEIEIILEYPVKIINVMKDPCRFQVDTGPLVFPVINKKKQEITLDFIISYIAFNHFNEAEFLIREPTSVALNPPHKILMMDFSKTVNMKVENTIYCPN